MTFEQRCRLSEQCLPDAPYREMLKKLHGEMLEALAQPHTPPQRTWVDLTHDDKVDLFDEHNVYGSKWIEFASAVEAKLKERNA